VSKKSEYPSALRYFNAEGVVEQRPGPDLPFVNFDGSPYRLDQDYLGRERNAANPCPAPFEVREAGVEGLARQVALEQARVSRSRKSLPLGP
jgi:hypothetical protein